MTATYTIPFVTLPPLTRGQDATWEMRVTAPERVKVRERALAGATSVLIEPLAEALSNGDRILFAQSQVEVLNGNAASGVTTLPVAALTAPVQGQQFGQKIRNITSYTTEMEILLETDDVTEALKLTGTITSALNGLVTFTITAAQSLALSVKTYYFSVWRTDSGLRRPLCEGDLPVVNRGSLT